jgi:hypothetical protein
MTDTATLTALRAVALDEAPAKVDGDGRTVMVRLVKYGVAATVTDDGGRSYYVEQFAPGSVRAEIGSLVYREIPRSGDPHFDRPKLVGKISGFRSTDDGAYAEVRISSSTDGADLLADIDDELVRHVSMEFDAPTLPKAGTRAAGPVVHVDAVVHGLLFTNVPQSPGADVLGRRSTPGETTMSETPVAGPFKGTIDGNIDGAIMTPDPVDPIDPNASVDPNAQRAAPQQTSGAQRTAPQLAPAAGARGMPRSRFESFGEFAHAAAFGEAKVSTDERDMVYRALNMARAGRRGYRATELATTADVTGLLQTQWVNRIVDLMRAYTPTVNSFSSDPLPDKGLTIARPVIGDRPTVAIQPGDGGLLVSNKVTVVPANWTVNTYGGGQDMTIATMQRTEPAYLDTVMGLYATEMAKALELAVATAVVAAADDTNAVIDLAEAADTDIQTAFTAACLPFLTSLGRLPEFALISVKLWQRMANAVGTDLRPLFPTVSPFNPVGSVSLTSPDGQVRDLPFRVAPAIEPTGLVSMAIVGVPEAFGTMIGNTQTLQADVPETLLHNLAVFEFAAFGKIDAAGLVQIKPVP